MLIHSIDIWRVTDSFMKAGQAPCEREALPMVRAFQRWMCTVGNFLSQERAQVWMTTWQGYVGREDGVY